MTTQARPTINAILIVLAVFVFVMIAGTAAGLYGKNLALKRENSSLKDQLKTCAEIDRLQDSVIDKHECYPHMDSIAKVARKKNY